MKKRICAIVALLAMTSGAFAAPSCGKASWYGYSGTTATGEHFNGSGMTAAHRWLPFGTWVRVTMISTGRHVDVRINDRGPFVRGRVIDLSKHAAELLGLIPAGVAPVCVTVLG